MSPRPIRQPELTELRTFVLAVEQGSISGAAELLRISPTAATKRLNNLDALAGGRLLERTSRGARPTALGQRLLPAARRLLRDAEALLVSPSDERLRPLEGVHRVLRVARGWSLPDELLTDLETLVASVFRVTSDPLLITDHEGIVIDANSAYCRLAGKDRDALAGCSVAELGDWPGYDTAGEGVELLSQVGQGDRQWRLRTATGELQTVTCSVAPIQIGLLPLLLIAISPADRGDGGGQQPHPAHAAFQLGAPAELSLSGHSSGRRRRAGLADVERLRGERDR